MLTIVATQTSYRRKASRCVALAAVLTLSFSGASHAEPSFPAPEDEADKSRFNIADTFSYLLFDQHRDERIDQQEPATIDIMPLFYSIKNLPYNGEKWRSSAPDDVEIEAHEQGLEIEMKWQF